MWYHATFLTGGFLILLIVPTDGSRNSSLWSVNTAGRYMPPEHPDGYELRTDGGQSTVLDTWPAGITEFDDAGQLLTTLEQEETDPAAYVDLVDPICRHMLSFRRTIQPPPDAVLGSLRMILEATDPPADAPSLIGLLDQPWISRALLLDHLLEQDQRPLSHIPPRLSIDVEMIENLSAKTRMHCYEALARGPGDPDVFSALSRAASVFDGEVPMPGIDYNPDRWKRESGRRVVLAYSRERREDISKGDIKRALRSSWTAVLPDLAPYITTIVNADLHEMIVDRLDDGRGTSHLSGTPFIDHLVEQLLASDVSETQSAVREITLAALQQGIDPDDRQAVWGCLDQAYREDGVTMLAPITTRLMTPDLASKVDVDSYIDLITAGFSEQFPDRRSGGRDTSPDQVEKYLKTLSAALGSGGTGMLTTEQMATLARVLAVAEGSCKRQAARCLSAATHGHQELLVESGGLVTVLEATASARNANELQDYGKVLKVAGVYPPPEQVLAHYGSTNEALDRAAKRLARSLRAPYRSNPPGPHPNNLSGTVSDLADQLTIKYHTDSGIWRILSLSSPDRKLLSRVGQAIQDREDIQIALPYHDPHAFEVVVLAAVLVILASGGESRSTGDSNEGKDYRDQLGNTPGVAIFSPGTSARWGTFTDLEDCMERIGIGTEERATASATPLIDLVPRGHVDDTGQVEPDTNSTTVASDPPGIPVVRDLETLAALDPAVVLYNFIPEARESRLNAVSAIRNSDSETPAEETTAETEIENDQVDSRPSASLLDDDDDSPLALPDHTAVEIYGLYTARKRDDWHIGTGPPDELPDPVVPGDEALQTGQVGAVADGGARAPGDAGNRDELNPEGDGARDTEEAITVPETMPPASGKRASRACAVVSDPPSLTVHRVQGDGEMRRALEGLYEAVSGIDGRNPATRTPHNRLQRLKRDLERLPVPAAYHDSWVREQRAEGIFGMPASLAERHNAARDMVDEYPVVARHISDAVQAIDAVRETIEDENPLFEGLLRLLDDAHEAEEHVGILCPKKTHKDILYSYLADQSSIELNELDRLITLLDHDSVRTLGRDDVNVDRLVRFGIGERQTAAFYCHPAVDRVDVLAYDGTRPVLRVEQVMAAGFPVLPEQTALSVAEPTVEDEVLPVSNAAPDTVEAFVDDDRSFEESLFVSFLTDSNDEGRADGGSGGSAADRYRIVYESGESQTILDTHPLVVKNRQQLVSEGEYTLQRVAETEAGDTVVVIPNDTRNDLWEAYLEPHYEGESVDWVIERIALWYDAINTARETVEPEGRESTGGAIYDEIGDSIPEGRAAVRRWVHSVEQAEEPRDLLFRRELTIGPEYLEAVEAVAEEYGDARFQTNVEEVFDTMESVRREHANRGHKFWVDVANKACDDELFDRPGVTEKTVDSLSRISSQ